MDAKDCLLRTANSIFLVLSQYWFPGFSLSLLFLLLTYFLSLLAAPGKLAVEHNQRLTFFPGHFERFKDCRC